MAHMVIGNDQSSSGLIAKLVSLQVNALVNML